MLSFGLLLIMLACAGGETSTEAETLSSTMKMEIFPIGDEAAYPFNVTGPWRVQGCLYQNIIVDGAEVRVLECLDITEDWALYDGAICPYVENNFVFASNGQCVSTPSVYAEVRVFWW